MNIGPSIQILMKTAIFQRFDDSILWCSIAFATATIPMQVLAKAGLESFTVASETIVVCGLLIALSRFVYLLVKNKPHKNKRLENSALIVLGIFYPLTVAQGILEVLRGLDGTATYIIMLAFSVISIVTSFLPQKNINRLSDN